MYKKTMVSILMFTLVLPLSLPLIAAAAAVQTKAVNVRFTSGSNARVMTVGEVYHLAKIITLSSQVKLAYKSSNPAAAAVSDKGVVTAKGSGSSVITIIVNQKGYIGKATMRIEVGMKPKGQAAAPKPNAGPIVYKDLEQLNKDVKAAIKLLYKKETADLLKSEQSQLQMLLTINRKQLLQALVAIAVEADPSWSIAWASDFVAKQLDGDAIPTLFELRAMDPNEKKSFAIGQMIGALKSDSALQQLAELLQKDPDKSVRFSSSFYLFKFNSTPALAYLAQSLIAEQDELVLGNSYAGVVRLCDTDPERFALMLNVYYKLDADKQQQFISSLIQYSRDTIPQWIAYLDKVIEDSTGQTLELSRQLRSKLFDSLESASMTN